MSTLGAAALQRYQQWNSAIFSTLFTEPRAQAPVYLYLEPELLSRAAALAGTVGANARDELVEAVRATLLAAEETPFHWQLDEAREWYEDGMRDAPPFLALLSVLVLGAEAMVGDAEHAAHNYYDRLLELLQADEWLAARVRRSFKDSVELWHLLNDWLVQWDGELGLPSAQITDRRVNIGYPISQALVSAQDRRRLAEAFEDYGLRPGRRMALLEMEQYLSHWLEHSGAPARLRRVWANDEARRRVTQIACAELEAWPGPAVSDRAVGMGEDRQSGGRVPLLWRAELTRGSLPAIDLYLACQADPSRVEGSYQIIAPTDATGREGLEAHEGLLAIRRIAGSDLCGLEPWVELPLAALLAGAFTLTRREQPPATLARSSNPVLILAHDDRDGLWHEVSRAQLLERCIVLAHQDVLPKVEAHLGRYARAGYTKVDHSGLDGLPPGWVAFLDVVLADAPEDEAPGVLATLSPIRANVIALEGGLRLSRQTWHADAPPAVIATLAAEKRLHLLVERRRALAPQGPEIAELGEHIGRAAQPLAGLSLTSGDYLVALSTFSNGTERRLDEVPMRLRTASDPRLARLDAEQSPVHPLGYPWGLVSAQQDDGSGPAVSGAMLLEIEDEGQHAAPLGLPQALPQAERLEPRIDASNSSTVRTYAMPCAVLGYHYWLVDAAEPGDDWRTLKHMRCRECQREEWTRNRGRRRRAPQLRRRAGTAPAGAPRARLPALAAVDGRRPALDLMLDALSYIGSGSWAALREIAQALEPSQPWLATEAARAFSALGHIDITLDRRTQRPARWHVAPAALVETCDGSWVLAGGRSDRLIDAILSQPHIPAQREGASDGLAVIRAHPDSEDALLEFVLGLEAEGFPIALSERFSERLVSHLPALAGVLLDAEQFRLGSVDVERFDLPSRQWAAVERSEHGPGAYRTQLHGRLNGVVTGEDAIDVMRVTETMTAKHLAAGRARMPIVAYDPAGELLSVPIGAELPGLLDRVATLCSGAPAFQRHDTWTTHYPSVPASVARHLQRCLGL